MTFASAAAALVMKTCAPPILARFGFRNTLTVNAVIVGVTFMAYALFYKATPHWLIYVDPADRRLLPLAAVHRAQRPRPSPTSTSRR